MRQYIVNILGFLNVLFVFNISQAHSYKAKFWLYTNLVQVQLIDEHNGFVLYSFETKEHKVLNYDFDIESKDGTLVASTLNIQVLKDLIQNLKTEDIIYLGILGPKQCDPLVSKETPVFLKISWSQVRYIMRLPEQLDSDLYLTKILMNHLLDQKKFSFGSNFCEVYLKES